MGKNHSHDYCYRTSAEDVWKDIFTYSSNFHGNWHLSRHVFYSRIVPTAEKDPASFARWVYRMVKKSGVKVKSRQEFYSAIKLLKEIADKKKESSKIKQALYYLFDAGLGEPLYATRALRNSA